MIHRLSLACTLVLAALDVSACLCPYPPLKWTFKEHEIVVVGHVAEVRMEGYLAVHTLKVLDGLKGARAGDELVFMTSTIDSCGADFRADSVILLFANRDPDGTLSVPDCANLDVDDPKRIAHAKRRAWWWRSRASSIGWYPLRTKVVEWLMRNS